MKYFYIRRQSGGCDYTIGCGISVEELSAKTLAEAIEEVIGLPESWKQDIIDDVGEDDVDGNFEDVFYDMMADSGLSDIMDNNEFRIESGEILEVAHVTDMIPILHKRLKEAYAFKDNFIDKKSNADEKALYEKLHKKYGKKAKK